MRWPLLRRGAATGAARAGARGRCEGGGGQHELVGSLQRRYVLGRPVLVPVPILAVLCSTLKNNVEQSTA